MSKAAVIYWSMSGNTEAMASAVAEGLKSAGAEVDVKQVGQVSAADALGYDLLALGCPAMGAEELEDSEFAPFFAELEGSLGGRKVALFGSYGWGDGQWMRDWQDRVTAAGADLVNGEGLIANYEPDGDALEQCRQLGADLAG